MKPLVYGPARKLATLQNEEVAESSGLAISRRQENVFWTHNDSGDEPRLFAFDNRGKHLATCTVQGANALDWEDTASFTWKDKPFLLIGDVGDNLQKRASCELYLLEEPKLLQSTARLHQTIHFRYSDGPHDCEAVAVDPTSKSIFLCAKVLGTQAAIYSLPLPEHPSNNVVEARLIAKPSVPLITGMDISPDGRRAILVNYVAGFEFTRATDKTWAEAFATTARPVALPLLQQGEAVCYGADGKTLFLTSEKLPTPLWEIPTAPSTP